MSKRFLQGAVVNTALFLTIGFSNQAWGMYEDRDKSIIQSAKRTILEHSSQWSEGLGHQWSCLGFYGSIVYGLHPPTSTSHGDCFEESASNSREDLVGDRNFYP